MARVSLLSLLALFALAVSAHCSVLLPAGSSVAADSKFGLLANDDRTKHTDIKVDAVDDLTGDESADEDEVDEAVDDEDDAGDEMTGFPLEDLDEDALEALIDVEDQVFQGQASVHVAKKLLLDAEGLYTKGTGPLRRKRIAPLVGRLAFSVGRSLFRSFSRGRLSRSGSRITQQYHRRGTYQDALRDFNRLRPDNVRSFNGRISGQTGTMGRHRVTVRDGSSGNSRPTLEIRSHNGNMVRKFRYE